MGATAESEVTLKPFREALQGVKVIVAGGYDGENSDKVLEDGVSGCGFTNQGWHGNLNGKRGGEVKC